MKSGSKKWLEMASTKLEYALLLNLFVVIILALSLFVKPINTLYSLTDFQIGILYISGQKFFTFILFISFLLLFAFLIYQTSLFFRYRFWFLNISKYAYYWYSIYHFISFPQLKLFILIVLSITCAHIMIPKGVEDQLDKIIGLTFLFMLGWMSIYALFKSSRQLVIGKFKIWDNTNKAPINLSTLLHSRLESLATLFTIVDTALPQKTIAKQQKSGKPQVSAFGSSALFDQVVQSDLSIKTKWAEIPISAFLKIARIVFRKPEITGELQKLGDLYILTAQSSGKHKYSWRVLSSDFNISWIEGKRYASVERVMSKEYNRIKTPESEELLIYSMVEQLATRIYTDMGNVGSKRWQAVDHFINGIRYYRHTLTENTNHDIYLRRAEKEFFNAWQDDMTFDQCYYNLAIIHRALGQEKAACELLEMTKNQKHIPSLYAYADMIYNYYKTDNDKSGKVSDEIGKKDKLCQAGMCCNDIIQYSHQHAAVFDLIPKLKKIITDLDCNLEEHYKNKYIFSPELNAEKYNRTASAIAWKELCLNIKPRMREKLVQHAYDYAHVNLPVQKNRKDILEKYHLNLVGIFITSSDKKQDSQLNTKPEHEKIKYHEPIQQWIVLNKEIEKEKTDKQQSLQTQFTEVLTKPIDGRAHYKLGEFYENQGRYRAADDEYDIAFVMERDICKDHNLGATYFNRVMQKMQFTDNKKEQAKVVKQIIKYIDYLKHDLESARSVSYYEQNEKYNKNIAQYHYWLGRFNALLAKEVRKLEAEQAAELELKEQAQKEKSNTKVNNETSEQQNPLPLDYHSEQTASTVTLEASSEYRYRANHYFYKAAKLCKNQEIHYAFGESLLGYIVEQLEESEQKKAKEFYADFSLLETGEYFDGKQFQETSQNPIEKYCLALNILNHPESNQKDLQLAKTKLLETATLFQTPDYYFHLYSIAKLLGRTKEAQKHLLKARSTDGFSLHYNKIFNMD